MRTKLVDRKLPNYSKGEEIFNMVSHIVGGAIGITALVLCVVLSALKGNIYGVVSSAIYGATMILLYTMSSLYHGMKDGLAKRVLQILDHCSIYLLIAGSYTPLLLSAMRIINPVLAWVMFALVWALCILATTLTAIDLKKYQVFSMVCYIAMGWSIIPISNFVIEAISMDGFLLLLTGGVAYTAGAILYAVGKKKKYMHNIFHVFVLIGSVLHFLCILFYAL